MISKEVEEAEKDGLKVVDFSEMYSFKILQFVGDNESLIYNNKAIQILSALNFLSTSIILLDDKEDDKLGELRDKIDELIKRELQNG